MAILEPIPWRTFDGCLKQLAYHDLTLIGRELFQYFFPRFQEEPNKPGDESLQGDAAKLGEMTGGLMITVAGDPLSRRFAGWKLPRERYFSLAEDMTGDDKQTLAHELRAYRDPLGAGMIEVIDLARGCDLQVRTEQIDLDPEPSIAVLIHEFQNLPERLRKIDFQIIPALHQSNLRILRFPYTVTQKSIQNTIDLRFPDVRDWFFGSFRVPEDRFPNLDPTTAYSRFHLENARPPTPSSFFKMLPTLVNQDLGGGNPSSTGSTVQSIGNWLRRIGCAALIYPSARADASVLFNDGTLLESSGWNLVLYEPSPILLQDSSANPKRVALHSFDPNPWAWVRLPEGVKLLVAQEGSRGSGSFALAGLVNHAAEDYLRQLNALKIARRIHGVEITGIGCAKYPSPSRIFMIGVLTVRWLRFVVNETPADEINDVILELNGLSLPYGMYLITGRVFELWSSLYKDRVGEIKPIVKECVTVIHLVSNYFSGYEKRDDLSRLSLLGFDMEFLMLMASAVVKANQMHSTPPRPSEVVTLNLRKCVELSKDLLDELDTFYSQSMKNLPQDPQSVASVLQFGERLIDQIYQELKGNEIY